MCRSHATKDDAQSQAVITHHQEKIVLIKQRCGLLAGHMKSGSGTGAGPLCLLCNSRRSIKSKRAFFGYSISGMDTTIRHCFLPEINYRSATPRCRLSSSSLSLLRLLFRDSGALCMMSSSICHHLSQSLSVVPGLDLLLSLVDEDLPLQFGLLCVPGREKEAISDAALPPHSAVLPTLLSLLR